jgi:uncharacterized protein RhaS with RHS repeats
MHRAYDPTRARWLNRDPIAEAGGINLYQAVGSNPVNFRDPSGLFQGDALRYAAQLALEEEAAGLGPENPIADIVAAATLAIGVAVSVASSDHAPAPAAGGNGNGNQQPPAAATGGCPPEDSGSGAPPPDGTTPLFRAVSQAELQDLNTTGNFNNPLGIENKYFSTTAEGASSYAQQTFGTGLYQGPYSIVQTSIPTNLIGPTMQVTVDGGISTVVVPTELLPNLSPANTLPYSPLVP